MLATPSTYFLHLSLSSVILIDSSTGSPVHVLMLSIQTVRGLPGLRAPGIVPCIISFSGKMKQVDTAVPYQWCYQGHKCRGRPWSPKPRPRYTTTRCAAALPVPYNTQRLNQRYFYEALKYSQPRSLTTANSHWTATQWWTITVKSNS